MESPTAFDCEAPLGNRRAIIRRNPDEASEIELVEATWGSDPRMGDGISYRFLRSDSHAFPARRCLIAASEFHMRVGARRFRAALDGGNFFYLAAVWEPPVGEWPLSYRIVTVAANREVAKYQERQGAIIHRRQRMQWLDATTPEADILVTPPPRTFVITELTTTSGQRALAL